MRTYLVGLLSSLILMSSILLHVTPVVLLGALKALVPVPFLQKGITRLIIRISNSWIAVNNAMFRWLHRVEWEVSGLENLDPAGWYLVVSNHQSWVDIPILQLVLHRKIPFLKFFLKQQLIWVPFMGLAWWALDFPFMKRYSREFLEKNPHLRGKDLESTKRACEKFRTTPVSVMNFVEGTRFTPAKHQRQNSPYPHLLRPRAGGVAFVLAAMESNLKQIVDVTIHYPGTRPTFWELLCGKAKRATVLVQLREIPGRFQKGDYFEDPGFREDFQNWLNALWEEKNLRLERMKQETETAA